MYGDGLVVFGVFWGVLGRFGYFEAVGFQKRNIAHYLYGDALVGLVLGGYGCFNGPHDGYANQGCILAGISFLSISSILLPTRKSGIRRDKYLSAAIFKEAVHSDDS